MTGRADSVSAIKHAPKAGEPTAGTLELGAREPDCVHGTSGPVNQTRH